MTAAQPQHPPPSSINIQIHVCALRYPYRISTATSKHLYIILHLRSPKASRIFRVLHSTAIVMCFGGSSAKGDNTSTQQGSHNLNARPASIKKSQPTTAKMPKQDQYSPPAGPPPGFAASSSFDNIAPPPGPPPGFAASSRSNDYVAAPPPGPPPGFNAASSSNEYAPPPGPPPNFKASSKPESDDYAAPPPGPPPGQHDWQSAVPDTSLLPPPPMMGYDASYANNATEDQANRAIEWCNKNPLSPPVRLAPQGVTTLQSGVFGLQLPPGFLGQGQETRKNCFAIKTGRGTPDTCMTSGLPMYSVSLHSPLNTEQAKTIYFEVRASKASPAEIDFGIGFVAAPYPHFRLPGWERASLGVHGDDGHRYVNDKWGGKDFTQPFKAGDTVGIGMTLSLRNVNAPPSYSDAPLPAQTTAQTPINVEVFFTRNGNKEGGWNLHEEADADQDLPVTGLEGLNDLYASVGMFEATDFEIVFEPSAWLYRP